MKNEESLLKFLTEKRRNVQVENLSMSIGELMSLYANDEIIIRPEYQRLLKWTSQQKTGFIESLLIGLPTPSIFVSTDENGIWEVVDGLQRISTVIDYIIGLKNDDTKYIKNYKRFDTLNSDMIYLSNITDKGQGFSDKKYKDLPRKIQLELKRQRVNVVILKSGTSDDVKYELFQRINEGGTPILPTELRRAILAYNYQDILNKLEEVSNEKTLKNLLDKSFEKDQSYKTISSILYFLSFYNKARKGDTTRVSNVDSYITKYVRNIDRTSAMRDIDLFCKVIDIISGLKLTDKSKVFHGSAGNTAYSDTIFGSITIGIALNISNLPSDAKLKKRIKNMPSEATFKEFYKRGFSAANRITKMLEFSREYFRK